MEHGVPNDESPIVDRHDTRRLRSREGCGSQVVLPRSASSITAAIGDRLGSVGGECEFELGK